jgi:hypothetical protein
MTPRRLVLGLGPALPRAEVIEAAVSLAGSMDAELVGLFIEDLALLNFAALPFTQEIGQVSAERRRLSVEVLERQFRELAAGLRSALAGSAERHAVPWSFRVTRGLLVDELLSAVLGVGGGAVRASDTVLFFGEYGDRAGAWELAVQRRLAAQGRDVRIVRSHALAPEQGSRAAAGEFSGVLVLTGSRAGLDSPELRQFLREVTCPVLILPEADPGIGQMTPTGQRVGG